MPRERDRSDLVYVEARVGCVGIHQLLSEARDQELMARETSNHVERGSRFVQGSSNTFKTELVQRGFPMMSRWISTCSSVALS